MKKALINASVASMIYKFNMDNIEILEKLGYQVEVACNFGKENPISKEELEKFRCILEEKHIRMIDTVCPRSILAIKNLMRTYRQLKKIAEKGNYDLVHTQSPIGGVLCRIAFRAARKKGTKVIYTAHGFHFFKGAPIQNWIIFYPIEKFCSRFNDVLITINKEDYNRAKKHFHTKNIEYIPGVGVDINRFKGCCITKTDKRKELGIPQNAFVLLSVGELSERKNHEVVIKALGEIQDSEIYYLIAGKGPEYENYKLMAKKLGLSDRLILLGGRTDVDELCVAADVFVHPSIREGLEIAPLEGMAAGLPLISSYVNGIKDYTENGITGVCVENPKSVSEMMSAIIKMKKDTSFREECGQRNLDIVEKFSLDESKFTMDEIYRRLKIQDGGYSHLIRVIRRKEFGLSRKVFVLISVGEMNKNKNHKIIIEALGMLKNPDIHYFVVGKGKEENNLREIAKKLLLEEQVHFLGYRNDIKELLCASDAFCFPSKREGLGLAAIEAMASGLPLITSNIHGINDYSINGKTGYSCKKNSVAEFAKAIDRIRLRNREEFSLYSIQISSLFKKENVHCAMKSIYEQINA